MTGFMLDPLHTRHQRLEALTSLSSEDIADHEPQFLDLFDSVPIVRFALIRRSDGNMIGLDSQVLQAFLYINSYCAASPPKSHQKIRFELAVNYLNC